MLGHLGRHWIALLTIVSQCNRADLIAETHFSPSLGMKSAALTGGRYPPVNPAYHEFNLSELATPNFYLGHIGLDVIELRGSSARSARNLWSPHHLLYSLPV